MLKILVIDDSMLMRKIAREALEEAGFAVEEFLPGSELELMERIKTNPPNLVLSDFNMPIVDGHHVARAVRRTNAQVPVVIMTANRDTGRDTLLQTLGVRKILHKPIQGQDLADALREVIRFTQERSS